MSPKGKVCKWPGVAFYTASLTIVYYLSCLFMGCRTLWLGINIARVILAFTMIILWLRFLWLNELKNKIRKWKE